MDPAHLSTPTGVPAPDAGRAPIAISLADILAREVPLQWFESVAVAAGLCATLVEQQASGVPQPDAVSITYDGRVIVEAQGQGMSPTALPRLLHALLPVGETPAPLRLFVLHAMAPDSSTSMPAFAAALEYYERPGRAELIQAAYQRFLEAPEKDTRRAPRQVQLDEPVLGAGPAQASPRRVRPWVAAATLVVCAACAVMYGVAAAPRTGVPAPPEAPAPLRTLVADLGDVARGVTDAVTGAVREQVASVVGFRGPAPAAPQPEPAPPVVGASRRAAPTRAARPRAPAARVAAPAVDAPAPESAPAESETDAPIELAAVPFAGVDGRIIYSSGELDVAPPVLRDPHRLPGSLQVAAERTSNAMELIVDEVGSVERVTMVGPAMQLTDMMLLGAAKTWKFDPASKDGAPVKYRLRLDWVSGER